MPPGSLVGSPMLPGAGPTVNRRRNALVGSGSLPVWTKEDHMSVGAREVRAPRGPQISCKGWQQEAAMRMLMNNLDEEVAERPKDLVVYGGTGRAARSWEAYHAIVNTLKKLENDETLLVQSGKPVG